MSDVDSDRRISVSEDRMRLLLAEFKVDLMRELANYATIAALAAVEHRLDDLRTANEQRIAKLELWRASEEGGETQGRRISASLVAWVGIGIAVVTVAIYVYAANKHR